MISVIIPIHNNIRHLTECLDSVLAQSCKDFEIILADDGSDAETAKKIESLTVSSLSKREVGRDLMSSNFSINPPPPSFVKGGGFKIVHAPHAGAAAARNRGFAESHGEFIFFCDADVVLRKDCLERMTRALAENPGASYAYSDYRLGYKKMPGVPFDGEKLKKLNYISTMSLVRRQDFPGFDESLRRFQDWDLWLTLLEQGKAGIYIPEVLFTAHQARLGISKWRPRFCYKWLPWLPSVKEYNKAREIVLRKHHLEL